jgi:hypothetical protein
MKDCGEVVAGGWTNKCTIVFPGLPRSVCFKEENVDEEGVGMEYCVYTSC